MITASLYCELIPENGEFDLISLTISSLALDYLPDFKDNPFEHATKTKAETRIAATIPMILHADQEVIGKIILLGLLIKTQYL